MELHECLPPSSQKFPILKISPYYPCLLSQCVNKQPSVPQTQEDARSHIDADHLHTLLLNAVSQAVIATDLDGQIYFWNRAAEALYGWSPQEVMGRSVLDIVPVPEQQEHCAAIMAALQQGETWTGEFRVRDRQGHEFIALVHDAPIQDHAGNLIGIIGISADISPIKTTQAQLTHQVQQSEAFSRVVDVIHQSLDLDTIFSVSAIHISALLKAQVSIVQYLPERQCWVHQVTFNDDSKPAFKSHEVIPDVDNPFAEQLKRLEVVQVDDTRTIDDPINQHLAETDPGAWLLTPIEVDGRVWGSLTLGRLHQYVAWQAEDIEIAKQVAAHLAIAIDKAEAYDRLQQELLQRRANETRLRQYESIVSATIDGIALVDRHYIYRIVNQVYLDRNQKSREEIVGHSIADLMGEKNFREIIQPRLDQCFQGEWIQYDDCFSFAGMQNRHLSVTYAPYYDRQGQIEGAVVTSRDITELKRAQDALAQQATQERAINHVVQQIHQSLNVEDIFPTVLEAINSLVETDHISIAKYVETEQHWHHVAEYRASDDLPFSLGFALPDHDNLVAADLKQGKAVCIDDCTTLADPIYRQLIKVFPGAWLIVPLQVNQRLWGVLILKKLQPYWPPTAIDTSTRIAEQLAIGIHQAELYQVAQAELRKRRETEQALQDRNCFFQSLYEQATLGIAFCHPDGTILHVNAKYCAITGYGEHVLKSMSLDQLIHADDRHLSQEIFRRLPESAQSEISLELRCLKRNSSIIWLHLTASIIRDVIGQFKMLAVIIQDISDRKRLEDERKKAEAQLRHNALHDALTQLPNRNLLMTQLERTLARIRRRPHPAFGVMFLDLDRFKLVNDGFGHLAGDQLLTEIAKTLTQLIRPGDLVARIGGDEFVILLEYIDELADILSVANRIREVLQQPFQLGHREVLVTASIGIVVGSPTYQNATELLRDADIAMYRAKANGKDRYALFDPTLHEQVMYQLQLEQDLRRAIEKQQLELYYQPIVNLRDGSIFCLEALVRWNHPDQGLISPNDFIPLAEETGLVTALDDWALKTACQQLKQWQFLYPEAQRLKVSVNLSAQDLYISNLAAKISDILTQSGLAGQSLVLEMTESLLISDTPQIVRLIAHLQELSVSLAVDDFGTGYSSLSYLHRFPFQALKIDQVFTSNMRQGVINQEIVETIVALSDRLGMVAIAEGGETVEHIRHLQRVGCEYSQGFYFCRPLPVTHLEPLLQQAYPFADKVLLPPAS